MTNAVDYKQRIEAMLAQERNAAAICITLLTQSLADRMQEAVNNGELLKEALIKIGALQDLL